MPNLLTTPRHWRKKVILLKNEAAYAVDPVPTGAANWIEARNVQLTPYDATTAERNIDLPYFGNSGSVAVSVWSKLSFDVAMVGSGAAGTVPKWGAIMLGASFSETVTVATSVAYNLVTDNIGSLCGYVNIDGILHKFVGSRAEVKGKLTAKGIPMLSVEIDSLYTAPVDAAAPVVDRTGWQIEEAVNSVNTGKLTINAVDLAFSELSWACGNQLSRVDLPGPQLEVAIVDRKPIAQCTVLAPTLAVFDPYAMASANSVVDLSNIHGTVAGKKVKTDLKVRITNVGTTEVDGMAAYQLTMEPTPVAGNDEIAITCL